MLPNSYSLLLRTSRFASLSIHGHDMQLRKQLRVILPQFPNVWMIVVVRIIQVLEITISEVVYTCNAIYSCSGKNSALVSTSSTSWVGHGVQA